MPSFNCTGQAQKTLFVIALSLSLMFALELPVSAQTLDMNIVVPSVSQVTLVTNDCLHVMAMRVPHCRGKLIWLVLKRQLTRRVRWDTTRWGLPIYLEVDKAHHWQRLSIFCLHLTREPT